jgi:hypothetical protein
MIAQAGIVFGKNWIRPGELSPSSKLTALAAAKILQIGLVDRLIWTGGQTVGPNFPSESRAMINFARENGYGDCLMTCSNDLEEISLTTRKNIKNIYPLISEMNVLAACTTDYHMLRAIRILMRPLKKDIVINPFRSEEIIDKYGNHFEKTILNQYANSKWVEKEKSQEPKIDLVDRMGLGFTLDWVAYLTRR